MVRQRYATGNRFGIVCLAVAVVLLAYGSVALVNGITSQRRIAVTKNAGTIDAVNTRPTPAGLYLGYSEPTQLSIPAVGIDSALISVGKTASGQIDTPQKPNFDRAAWYRYSPTPGQYGVSVIVGHVDSYDSNNGASVFYNLAKLKPGDTVTVQRTDNRVATFTVYATRQYNRSRIPSDIYTNAKDGAELRLITCAGTFDTTTDEYDSNTVIFARLTESPNQG